MTPIAGLALAAAALGGYWLYTNKLKPGAGEGTSKPLTGAPVEKLEKGKTYTVLAVVTKDITQDSRWNMSNEPNAEKIANLIAATFAQSGGKVLNKPTIRNGEEMQKAIAGEPSTWVFNMQWLLDGDHITNVIPWLAGATFYQVPIA